MTTQTIPTSQRQLWLAAIKLPMYSVAIMPIWVGSAIAFFQTQTMNWRIFATFMTAAIFILAWENLYNDVFDSETGIDKNKHHSLINLTQNKSLIFWLANLFLALGIIEIIAISWWQQDCTVLGLILLACFLGYMYQGPPFRLGYHGLGEILCFVAFGPLGVAAAYYSQTQTWSMLNLSAIAASMIVGIATTLILFCSHFHQVEDDMAAGKRSPIVRLGIETGTKLLPWFSGSIFVFTGIFVALGTFPLATLLSLAGLPLAIKLSHHVQTYYQEPHQLINCKFIAVALHFISGSLLGLGFILSNIFSF